MRQDDARASLATSVSDGSRTAGGPDQRYVPSRSLIEHSPPMSGGWTAVAGVQPGLLGGPGRSQSVARVGKATWGSSTGPNNCWTVSRRHVGWVIVSSQHCPTVVSVSIFCHSPDFHTVPPNGFLPVNSPLG